MVTSRSIGIIPENFLTFSFNHFSGVKVQANLVLVPYVVEVEPRTPLKVCFFAVQTLKIFLSEMLELPIFGDMTIIFTI